MAALLKKHPCQVGRICEQLQGRQLPNSLRHLIWSLRLQRNNPDSIHSHEDLNTEMEEIRSQFEMSLLGGLKELGVSSTIQSPIARVIQHAVTEAYKYRPGLHSELVSEMQMKQAVEALNVLYVYNRSYEPQYALLVYPLIVTVHNEQKDASMMLFCYLCCCQIKMRWILSKVIVIHTSFTEIILPEGNFNDAK